MRIAVDGMGGDNSPEEIVKGCVDAVNEYGVEVIITGPQERINSLLEGYTYDRDKISVINTTEVISLNESPVMAIRRKKDSSMRVAVELVKEGRADAVVSAGSTGALLAGGIFVIGRIKGIDRPALAPVMPGKNGKFMVLDVGANTDLKAENLVQFAHMGKVYFESALGFVNPKVGLVNIGAEEEKGNELTKAAYQLLKIENDINFIGNVEPRDIPSGDCQILVCDGFVGNVVLKMYEGTVKTVMEIVKAGLMESLQGKIGGLLIKKPLKDTFKQFDYKEEGGSSFLGIDGIVVKAHGSSDARAIKNALRQAKKLYDTEFIEKFKKEMSKDLQ